MNQVHPAPEVTQLLQEIFGAEITGALRYRQLSTQSHSANVENLEQFLQAQAQESMQRAEQVDHWLAKAQERGQVPLRSIAPSSASSLQDVLMQSFQHELAVLYLYRNLIRVLQPVESN
jgi:ferritin